MTSSRISTNLILSFAMAAGLASLAGCAGQGDVDRTQPDKIDKSIFLDAERRAEDLLLPTDLRRTCRRRAPGPSRARRADTRRSASQIHGEVPASAYRAYDYAPGSENPFTGGDQQHRHARPDATASSRTSTSSASTTPARASRPTSSARTRPTGPGTSASTCASTGRRTTPRRPISRRIRSASPWLTTTSVPSDWHVSETRLRAPGLQADRPIMTDDYIDFVHKQTRTPDYQACLDALPGHRRRRAVGLRRGAAQHPQLVPAP